MNFVDYKPEAKSKLGGSAIRVDEYLGVETQGGIEFHSYNCTKISRADGAEQGTTKLASSIAPTDLQVDAETGLLVEAENRLSRPNKITGKAAWIVKPGTGLNLTGFGF